jgi:rhodanese-related sulfurtransferase
MRREGNAGPLTGQPELSHPRIGQAGQRLHRRHPVRRRRRSAGFARCGGEADPAALTQAQQLSQLGVEELHAALRRGEAPRLLDVRTAGDWDAEHIEGAAHIPLPGLPRRASELNKDVPLAVICGSGYRSSIAASLLLGRGFTRVQNVMGGMGAYLESRVPEWQPSELVFIGENI